MTAVPQWPNVQIYPRLAVNQQLPREWRPPVPELHALDSKEEPREKVLPPSTMQYENFDWRALLRGCRGEHNAKKDTDSSSDPNYLWPSKTYCEIHADGILELGEIRWVTAQTGLQVRIGLILYQIGTLMGWADSVRRKSQQPGAEYEIDMEICFFGRATSYADFPGNGQYTLQVPPVNCRFFPFPVGNAEEQNDILATVRRDLYNWMGLEPKSTYSYHLVPAIQTDSQQSAK